MLRKYLTIFLTLSVLTVFAQTGKLFDADKQLSSSFTSQVYLDHDGLIWVATRNGLNMYDGYKFHHSAKPLINPVSLGLCFDNNKVLDLSDDNVSNNVCSTWVCTVHSRLTTATSSMI